MSQFEAAGRSLTVKVIACGVFERELQHLAADAAGTCIVQILDAGLHERPDELRRQVQAAVDATPAGEADRIAIVYGLCGRGAVGLTAREIPVVLPRVHDCIALFLGAPDEYRRQFQRCPGTYYMTPGWFEKKAHPDKRRVREAGQPWSPRDDSRFGDWARQFGEDNATAIAEFFASWRRNYKRIALINNGLGDEESERGYCRMLADAAGWTFEELPGGLDFLRDLALGPHDERFLVVPPGHRVAATHDARIFCAVPADGQVGDAPSGLRPGTFHHAGGDAASDGHLRGIGLGIDAGGTYTDAALVDFATGQVVAKAKAPTTHEDLPVGIDGALAKLDPELRRRVELVSLSTTLATNALVENRGAKVGLLLMPVSDKALDQVDVQPAAVVPGKLSIYGGELEPVDPDAVRRTAQAMLADGVEAFAVSGYGSVHNAAHEQQVKAILAELADVPVVCGHELSAKLDFIRRAYTAVLNARLLPLIDELLHAVEEVLARYRISAPIYIVRGDASLVEMSVARQRPIDTILSGPAASAVGARYLTDTDDVVAVDIGGTTTDVAILTGGHVAVCPDGATVGPWRTSVAAGDILTGGLGGDSYVRLLEGGTKLTVGPERVIPLCLLAARHPAVAEELAVLAAEAERDGLMPYDVEFFELVNAKRAGKVSPHEGRLIEALADGPMSRRRLTPRVGVLATRLLPTERLESLGVLRRSAFTPTDALHVQSLFSAYDTAAAHHAARALAAWLHTTPEELARRVHGEVVKRLAYHVVRRELTLTLGDPDADQSPLLERLIEAMLSGANGAARPYSVAFREHRTLVGIGAPADVFLPHAGELLGATAVVPEHAEVANAVGAIVGKVLVREAVRIRPDDTGAFVLLSPEGRREFGDLGRAQEAATDYLVHRLRAQAAACGTATRDVTVQVAERTAPLADGEQALLEVVVLGVLEGAPQKRLSSADCADCAD